jgi:hypothetical protein
MRLGFAAAFVLVLPLLAACSNDQPPAKPSAEASTQATLAAATPAKPVAVKVAPEMAPLLGTWAPALASCGDQQAITTITETKYTSPAGSCDISLSAGKDGSFSTTCGKNQMTLTPVFAPTGEGVNVVVGDGKRQTVLRCSR